jgi:hypothetical protein
MNPLYRSVCDTFQTTRKSGFDCWWEEKCFLSPVMGPIQLPNPRVPRNLPWGGKATEKLRYQPPCSTEGKTGVRPPQQDQG